MQNRIANSIKQINKARDRLREGLQSRGKALRNAKKRGRFTVMHHVDWQSFQLEHLKKVLRAQRQVEDAGHRYVVLYWAPDDNINKKNGEQDGNLMSLRLALPNDGKGMVYAISPGALAEFDEKYSVHRSPNIDNHSDSEFIEGMGAFYDCFQDFAARPEPIVGSSSSNSTVQRPYTYWRRRCADRIAAVWLDNFINGNSSSIGSSHQEMFTPHYWLLDVEADWVGSLPQVLARWEMKNRKNPWNSMHYLGCCYPARDFRQNSLRQPTKLGGAYLHPPRLKTRQRKLKSPVNLTMIVSRQKRNPRSTYSKTQGLSR